MRACVKERTGVDLVSERLADLHGMRTESGQEGRTGVERAGTRTRIHGVRASVRADIGLETAIRVVLEQIHESRARTLVQL